MAERPPVRVVVNAIDFEGPRGGRHVVEELECGHTLWRRAKRPRQQAQCVMCWLDQTRGEVASVNKATQAAKTDGHRVLGSGYEAKIAELEAAHAALLRQLGDKIIYIHDLIAERDRARAELRRCYDCCGDRDCCGRDDDLAAQGHEEHRGTMEPTTAFLLKVLNDRER